MIIFNVNSFRSTHPLSTYHRFKRLLSDCDRVTEVGVKEEHWATEDGEMVVNVCIFFYGYHLSIYAALLQEVGVKEEHWAREDSELVTNTCKCVSLL